MNIIDLPIIACSTSIKEDSAIAVLRISGTINFDIFLPFFDIKKKIIPRHCYYTKLLDNNSVLDEIVLIYFNSPNSFTGEDILELHIHGNRLNIKRALNLFISSNTCRLAKEGEFSYRAFKNKKMTLTQVEGLERFINARTPLALTSGMSLLNGELNREYAELYSSFLFLKSSYELGIDFLEDVGEKEFELNLQQAISLFDKRINCLLTRAKFFNKELLSPQVAVFGMPNAGKSSFFNYILNKDRSIISSIPGTTRDYVSEYVEFTSGIVKFVDTAGLRDTNDQIEKVGIKKTIEIFSSSIFKILIVNPLDRGFFTSADELISRKFDLVVFTHCEDLEVEKLHHHIDLIDSSYFLITSFDPRCPRGAMELNSKSGPIGPVLFKDFVAGPIGPKTDIKGATGPIGPVFIKNFSGPIGPDDNLLKILNYFVSDKISQISGDDIVAERHVAVIEELGFRWKNFLAKAKTTSDLAIVLSELMIVEDCVGELVGHLVPDEVLDNIFKNFCIGK